MKKMALYALLLLVPLVVSLSMWAIVFIQQEYFPYSEDIVDDLAFIIRFLIIPLGMPVYLAIVNNTYIYKYDLDICPSLVYGFILIAISLAICWPNSIYAYGVWIMGGSFTEALNDYIDFFPLLLIFDTIMLPFMMVVIMLIFRAYKSIRNS